MPTSTPSSVSRYRPAVLVLTGAAAAYAAYLIYSTVSALNDSPADNGLHRSNAVRRPNPRSRRPRHVQHAQPLPLGEFDFFGVSIELEPSMAISPDALRQIASEAEPAATPEQVNHRIAQLHDVFLDRFLRLTFPNAPIPAHDTHGVSAFLVARIQNPEAIAQAMRRHAAHFAGASAAQDAHPDDDGGSVAGTEVSLIDEPLADEDVADPHGQVLQRTLYHIAEDRARTEGVIHRGITCNACDTKPIRGIRWHCANCHDFDLCSDCKATNSHIKTHIFYEIRVPVPNMGMQKQEPLYPGRPHAMPFTIPQSLKRRLVAETNMESEEIEALYETFTCLAATEWDSDPNQVGYAMDRRAFNQAFVPRYSTFMSAPNLIYDRIFAYYDSNLDGNIGFEEFVKGLDGMHSRDFDVKIKIIFNGYDIDGDGYISRKDVLRIFRAFYAIEQEATRNYLHETAEDLSNRGAVDIIHSSQPLGSAFTQSGIPDPLGQRRHGKPSDETANAGPVLMDDTDDTMGRDDLMRLTSSIKDYDNEGRVDEQTIKDRWERRQFYIDEEEGFRKPQEYEESLSAFENGKDVEEDGEIPVIPEQERPRGSRSSSRVRFQDDVDFDTRSNASTSSRLIGERWGGYEIPEPEKDLGKEVLYQITQQGFNELLNPLFQDKEDNAMDALATRAKRRELAHEIEEERSTLHIEWDINRLVAFLGIFRYSQVLIHSLVVPRKSVAEFIGNLKQPDMITWALAEEGVKALFAEAEDEILAQLQPPPGDWQPSIGQTWNAKLCRLQLRQELINFVCEAAAELDWLPCSTQFEHIPTDDALLPNPNVAEYKGPMLPQFRSNSESEIDSARYSAQPSQNTDRNISNNDSGSDTIEDSFLARKFSGTSSPIQGGPYFIVKCSYASKQENRDALLPDGSTPEPAAPPPPRPASPLPPPTLSPPVPNLDSPLERYAQLCDNEPILFFMSIRTDDLSFGCITRPTSHNTIMDRGNELRAVQRKIRRDAMDDSFAGDLAIPFLASLEEVDKEIEERKGAGLISLREFEERMRDGNLRFLESWMDWVSF